VKAKTKLTRKKKIPGPKPEVLKLEGNWKDAIKESLKKRRPPEGWPESK
jgi:hypothetical protein